MRRAALIAAAMFWVALTTSCPKADSPVRLPPSPAPVAPSKPSIVIFSAEPTTISKGQVSSLRWSVKDAASVRIDNGIGQVRPEDHVEVSPTDTATYTLEAMSGTESTVAVAKITVLKPTSGAEGTEADLHRSRAEFLTSQLHDVHFEYGKGEILREDQSILEKDAAVLKNIFQNDPELVVTIEGHCDERGSSEYNLGLGDRRANFIREYLVGLGVPESKLGTLSYGKERPVCVEATEHCLAQNRRAHFSLLQ